MSFNPSHTGIVRQICLILLALKNEWTVAYSVQQSERISRTEY